METRKDLVNIPFNGGFQWWLLSISTEHISIHQCMTPSKLSSHRFLSYIKNLDKSINGMQLYAEPLIDPNENHNLFTNFRGNSDDHKPFLYRKKPIPMIRAEIYHYWKNTSDGEVKTPTVLFRSPYSTYGILTDGMKSFLHQNFDSGLIKCYTPETMQYLKDQAIRNAIKRMRNDLDDLSKGIETFHEELDKYMKEKNML